MTVYIFLDNDGVTNQIPYWDYNYEPKISEITGWGEVWYQKLVPCGSTHYRISWNPDSVSAINELIQHENTELISLSDWQEASIANYYPSLGINAPEGTRWIEDSYPKYLGWGIKAPWWKLQAMQEFLDTVDKRDSIVWIDDNLNKVISEVESMVSLYPSIPFHIVSPEEKYGIKRSEIESIKDFIEKQSIDL